MNVYRTSERLLLKGVFQDDYSENLTTYDLLDHLADQARRRGFEDDGNYVSLCKGLRSFSSQYGSLINGQKGERCASRSLNWLKVPHESIENVVLEYEGETNEYDQIIVTSSGIFIIEVKYSTMDTVIDAEGYLRGKNWDRFKPYNVGEKVQSKEFVLWKTIQKNGLTAISRDQIRTLLLFANDRTRVSNEFGKIAVVRCGNVNFFIEEQEKDFPGIGEVPMHLVRKAIQKSGIAATYKNQVDIAGIIEDYKAVLKLVEDGPKAEEAFALAYEAEMSDAAPSAQQDTEKESGGAIAGTVCPNYASLLCLAMFIAGLFFAIEKTQ